MENPAYADELSSVKRPDSRKLDNLLRSGCLEHCREEFDSILNDVRFRELESVFLRIYVCTDMYITARSFAQEIGINDSLFTASFGNADDLGRHLMTPDSTAAYLYTIFEQCIRWRIELAKDKACSSIRNAIQYLDTHYMDNELSLLTVAHEVGLSPNYFSALFKKETGKCFSDYLNTVRVEQAKQFLCCTSKMIYEIAFEVGFQDYRYFSQIFKKYTGQTPRQFKNRANDL